MGFPLPHCGHYVAIPNAGINFQSSSPFFQILAIFTKKIRIMSDHSHDHHADNHGHDDHAEHGSGYTYFDESTSILVPVFIIIALIVIFGVVFFG